MLTSGACSEGGAGGVGVGARARDGGRRRGCAAGGGGGEVEGGGGEVESGRATAAMEQLGERGKWRGRT